MAQPSSEIALRISVLNANGQHLGGTVDVELKPKGGGESKIIRGADASQDIDIRGLQRGPNIQYDITVTPTGSSGGGKSDSVNVPASGFSTVRVVVGRGSGDADIAVPPANTVQGSLLFDTGLPAAGIAVKVYNIAFAGKATLLGSATSDAQSKYAVAYTPPSAQTNLQVRVADPAGKEITISGTKFNADQQQTLNLVVPSDARPLAPEFQRLSADVSKTIGSIAQLGQAQESGGRQDLTLLSQATRWDARLVALAASAAQQIATTGLGQDVLYALFRVGLPTDPALLATVPSTTVQQALSKASKSGIVSLTDQQITASTATFQNFATKTLLTSTAAGAASTFTDIAASQFKDNPTQQAAFANLFFNQPAGSNLWTEAAKLNIPAATLDSLRLQGKFLYLTFNNAVLAQRLQKEVGSLANLPAIADKDYHQPTTWQAALKAAAGTGGDKALDALIPPAYTGGTTADRLSAYSADLARKVRVSFPTRVVARMAENKEFAIDPKTTGNVAKFLRTASTLGYDLGRTPLNAFMTNSAKNLPALDGPSKEAVKSLHRIFQVTPSTESMQAALSQGFTSANEIASYSRADFLTKYTAAFPPGEAELVYGHSQTISSITFNIFAQAKALDNSAPVYALSSPASDRQSSKNALVEQFPSMASLFGNLDFCQCEDCRSVLSPAAYFVDVLDLLGQNSAPNAAGNTPLDVLIGKDGGIKGRRPDLGALPLTCSNTNTALPYIDLVNEIFEYYIAHSNSLDAGAAYDTGSSTSADLIAEPQHVIPSVYSTTLKQTVYPLNLPFDLWLETVRGFLNYFKAPLAQVLDTLRPADTLELFTSGTPTPYYRAQILSESLGISPAEYAVFTATDTTKWFNLHGSYATEAAALADLSNAKTLSRNVGVSYQGLADLVKTGFVNPALYPLIFQFERFGIDMGTAFSFTTQPGFPALTAPQTADFQAQLNAITARYKQQNPGSTFDATTWLKLVLPANYSTKVLVLADPNTGCNFSGTTLQYADGSAAKPLDYLKINLLVRLCNKLGCNLNPDAGDPADAKGASGWSLDEVDRALQAFFPSALPAFSDPGFSAAFGNAWKTALVYLAHLDDLNTRLSPALGRIALLPLWQDLPTLGENPLYAQLFLTSSVLNNDFAFDDPNGAFPAPSGDLPVDQRPLSAHAAAVQGALSLTAAELTAILADASVPAPAAFSLANLSVCYRYSLLAQCLQIPVADLIALKTMSGLNPFQKLTGLPLSVLADDILLKQTIAFVKQVAVVQNSGFSVDDLRYLLRHQFDPVGIYQSDPNALIALVQTIGSGLARIQAQNAVPSNLLTMPETLIDQSLSGLFPAAILKTLFSQLSNSQTYTATATSATALTAADFAAAPELTVSYDAVTTTQSLSYKGLLLDWRKAELQLLNQNAALNALFSGLLDGMQQQARTALANSIAAVVGVWASLVQYEGVSTGVTVPQSITDPLGKLAQADPSLSFAYDQADQLQWLGYRGVLTDAKLSALTAINPSATLATLLGKVQQQALPAYNEMAGTETAIWCNSQTYKATQGAVAPAGQIDVAAYSAALDLALQNGTITDPVPAIQISYDAVAQVQTLTCAGVLTNSMRGQLAGLIASPLLGTLLQSVRNQAVSEFQFLANGLVAAAINDPDPFLSFAGVDPTKQQRAAKAELVKVFLPLLARKLSRQLVLQTLSATLGADASLTEALVTDAALLNNPNDPGKSLLQAFLALGNPGVSASYFHSANLSGAAAARGVAISADTADPTNSALPTGSCHFEGYLQVPTDGPYRFFAELGNNGAKATLRIDSPDPNAIFPNPIVQATATKDHDEASQFVQLKGGVAYHFAIDFQSLGTNGASMLIQGENLPKGPLSQVVLYPQQSVDAFGRARVLLAKVLQILQVTGIDLREVSYLVAHAAQFSNLRLSSLPTQAADDTPAKAAKLFTQFLTLADYADLRKGPAGGTDGLIDVFQAATQASPPVPPATLLANLTRRDPQTVQAVATALGASPHFTNNLGIRRMWDALQLVQLLGLPVQAVSAATAIVTAAPPSPDAIAANFRNAVKAQYTPEQWLPIAQSVYDPLRRKKRDALVSHLVDALQLDSSNQLFEYFLVDPGMEPVVQTSRLRLALSSVQTFIQRCFLNLESGNSDAKLNVAASAIPADWWPWMKRYRVWQANREIFLFPENWMQPELRMDKTDLFQTLEGALLQGDVTPDLVEDAFLGYLKGLDLRARLDIVASYFDQNITNPGESTLYVLGRTYGHPHKYFTRTYSNGVWSGWEAVTADIESDHMVLAVWRGRLNLLWLTFITKAKAPDNGATSGGAGVGSLSFDTLFSDISSSRPQQQVQIQLHWSEYVHGKWTNRISTDVKKSEAINVMEGFDPSQVHLHVSKEIDSSGEEGALKVHVDFPFIYDIAWIFGEIFAALAGKDPSTIQRANHTFRVTSKNCDPVFSSAFYEAPPPMPYDAPGVDATQYTGSAALTATFLNDIKTDGSGTNETEKILDHIQNFDLLTCANAVVPPFLPTNDPQYQVAGGLVSPFFFKDASATGPNGAAFLDERTFFVQPSLTETVVEEWDGWAIGPVVSQVDPNVIGKIDVIAQVPASPIPIDPGDPVYSVFPVRDLTDWVTHPSVAVSYGGVAIGKTGGIQNPAIGGVQTTAVNVNGATVAGFTAAEAGAAAAGLVLVGSQGVNVNRLQAVRKAGLPAANFNPVARF